MTKGSLSLLVSCVLHGLPPHRFLEALEKYHDTIEGREYEGDTNSSHLGSLVFASRNLKTNCRPPKLCSPA